MSIFIDKEEYNCYFYLHFFAKKKLFFSGRCLISASHQINIGYILSTNEIGLKTNKQNKKQ